MEEHLTTNINAFLASTSSDAMKFFNELIGVLFHAQIDYHYIPESSSIEQFKKQTGQLLNITNCSIHIIGDRYELVPQLGMSKAEFHYHQAFNHLKNNNDYRIFIWRPAYYTDLPKDQMQRKFIFNILNNINENIIYSTHQSPIMLVEDIRSIMVAQIPAKFDVKNTEIYLIFNEIDEESALTIKDLLSDVATVETTSISLSSDIDYDNFVVEQIKKSVLPVIYFKKAATWANYFIKEIWRKTGGLSSHKTFLLIGDESNPESQEIKFSAPNVLKIITSEELIPLEIKVALDNIKNKVQV